MSTRSLAAILLFLSTVSFSAAGAQEARKPLVAIAPAGSPAGGGAGLLADRLGKQQREAVRTVSGYFSQLTTLKGTFVQTSADGVRQRGKFYIKRPGQFRFDYARPSRLVIVSDGTYVAIQDHDLGTDNRWELSYTPFRMLLQKDVDLLRDGRFFEVQETADAVAISVAEKGSDEGGRIRLVFAKQPALHLQEWTAKDAQGLDTHVLLSDLVKADDLDQGLFNPAATAR
jgi:outer membrane lipoprotein-sorting protein